MVTTFRRSLVIMAPVLVVVALTALAGCARSAATARQRPTSISIGLLTAVSGAEAPDGLAAAQGAQLAVEVANGKLPRLPLPLAGGLSRGVRLTLVTGDTKGDPAAAAEQAGKLARQQHMAGLVVAASAPVANAVGHQADRAHVSLLDACSSADALTASGLDWYFRTGPSDRLLAETAFGLMRQERGGDPAGGRRLALLEGGGGPDSDATAAVRQFADDEAYDTVARLPLSAASSGADLAGKVTAARPDAVIANVGSEPEAAVVADVAQRLRTVPVLVLGHGLAPLGSGGGPVAGGRGALRTVGWSPDLVPHNPVARAVAELYQRRFGAAMSDVAAGVFTATLTLAGAVDATDLTGGPDDATRVRAALRQLSLPASKTIMPWNGIRFDGSGQNQLAAGVVEQRTGAGFQVVYPRELATVGVSWRR